MRRGQRIERRVCSPLGLPKVLVLGVDGKQVHVALEILKTEGIPCCGCTGLQAFETLMTCHKDVTHVVVIYAVEPSTGFAGTILLVGERRIRSMRSVVAIGEQECLRRALQSVEQGISQAG